MKNFLIYRSSAGSGKTYTLVKKYLGIVLKDPGDFKHTLAVTFTNKAAAEMKNRIVEKLLALSAGSDKQLQKELEIEFSLTDPSTKAKAVLDNILHKYSYFSVFTIDSFFYRVIRSFARELKLHISNDLELDEDAVLNKITDELLDKAGSDKELTNYLENFIYYYVDEDRGWKIDMLIKDIGSEIFKERYFEKKELSSNDPSSDRKSMKELIGVLFGIVKKFESEMLRLSDEALSVMEKYGLEIDDFPFGKSGVMNYLLSKIRNNHFEPTPRVREIYANPAEWIKKTHKQNQVNAVNDGLKQILKNAVDLYDKDIRRYNTAAVLIRTIYVLGIFNDLLNELKLYRDENKLILISDMNNILQKVISTESSPFVYEKTGSVYKHFLIDEFQDTSRFQWNNIYPLIINSLSENNISMVVGDVKQSIYRWRNGNMKLLLGKIYSDLAGYKEVIGEEHLTGNWRSCKEIVEFNNNFFQKASAVITGRAGTNEFMTNAYSDCVQKSIRGEGGYVRVEFIDRNNEFSTTDTANSRMLEAINELRSQKYSFRDILILVRRNVEGANAARFLDDNNIKVVSNESLLINNSAKVKLLINLLKYILDKSNALAKTEILYNYIIIKDLRVDPDKIFNDYKNSNNSLFNSLLPADFFRKTHDGKNIDHTGINPSLNNLTLYELTEHLIMIFGLHSSPDAYLQRFQDMIIEYMRKNNSDIAGFLAWWDENKEKYSIIVPEQEDAARIMTIHTAKGLQSKAVIIPYANWNMDINGNKDLIWAADGTHKPFGKNAFIVKAVKTLEKSYFEEDYREEFGLTNLDNLNLLYVAFTRAEERLYVIAPEKAGGYTVFNVLNEVIQKDEFYSKDFNDEIKIFETGSKGKTLTKAAPGVNTLKTNSWITSDWYGRIIVRPGQGRLIPQSKKDYQGRMGRGIMIHKILSYIRTADDVELALDSVKNAGLFASEDVDKTRTLIEQLMGHEKMKNWFLGEWDDIKLEAEILEPGGEVLRPDRVMIKGDKAVVVDYKTGGPQKEYEQKLKQYSSVLMKLGYSSVDKYIVYTDEPTLIEVQ